MLSQLVYVSNRHASCTEEEIRNILDSCKRNNPVSQITGILLYSEAKFIQMVEAEAKVVAALYDKIKADKRHSGAVMISYGPIKEKSFPGWHMGVRKIAESEVDFKTSITKEEREVYSSLLNGREEDGMKVLAMLKKFF